MIKVIGIKEIEAAIEVLKVELEIFEGREYFEKEEEALKTCIGILNDTKENEEAQEIHSQITIDMEQGEKIPLKEWARKNGIDESTARQKARRGGFKTAHKIGRDWFISEMESNPDGRRKK